MKHIFLTTLALGVTAPIAANATMISFIQDVEISVNGSGAGVTYTGTHDAEIRQDDPTGNYNEGTGSANPEFTVDGDDGSGADAHVLMRFDDIFGSGAHQIPVGSTIVSATLFIDVDNTGDPIELRSMDFNWGSETAVTWDSVGGGIIGVGSLLTTLSGALDKEFIDVTAAVAGWSSDPSTNFGFGFVPTGSDGVDFDASENIDSTGGSVPFWADRPSLSVSFRAPRTDLPEPGTLALFALGLSGVGVARRRRKTGGNPGSE